VFPKVLSVVASFAATIQAIKTTLGPPGTVVAADQSVGSVVVTNQAVGSVAVADQAVGSVAVANQVVGSAVVVDQSVGSLSVSVVFMPNAYDIGDTVRITATFKDSTDALANPTTVTIKVRQPDTRAIIVGTVINDSVGVFHADFGPTVSGRWAWRVLGVGVVNKAAHGEFEVNVQEIP
jgi:hypothetical protein